VSFNNFYYQLTTGENTSIAQRVAGSNIAYVRKYVKSGGELSGHPAILVALINDADITLIESEEPSSNFLTIPSAQLLYDHLEAAGMSLIVPDQLMVNPSCISTFSYDDTMLKANVVGPTGVFQFLSSRQVTSITQKSDRVWEIPTADFIPFRTLALQRLSSIPSGLQASSYIEFAGTDDYVNFTGGNTTAGYLDWTKDWTLGITLVGYPLYADNKYQCLFASGNNVIMIRRGGTNQALYIASNNSSYASQGINTWNSIEAGDRVQFEYEAATRQLRYFKGQPGQVPVLVGVLVVNQTNIDANDPGDDFAIGRGNGAADSTEILHWDGGVNNFIGQDGEMGTTARIAYFEAIGETYDEQSWYGDLSSWCMLGEDTYPTVTDHKGALTGGALMNGTEDDFVEIPSE